MNNEILYELLQNPNSILIEQLYLKYNILINNFWNYIIDKNFKNLKILEIEFSNYIIEFVNSIKKIKKEIFIKYGFLKILKKIMVQKIIMIERSESNNKKNVLHSAINQQYNATLIDDKFNHNIHNNVMLNLLIEECDNIINNNIQKKIFNLLILGHKAKEISNILNINIKKIYNHIFYLKNEVFKRIYKKYFN